jgi:hypothetical protein
MECKKCQYNEFEERKVNMHVGLYCKNCGTWQKFVKQHNTDKTANQYKIEYMEKQLPTKKQLWYIKEVVKYKGIVQNKWEASQIIDSYIAEQELGQSQDDHVNH